MLRDVPVYMKNLEPEFDGARSFYGKAQVQVFENGDKRLYSYQSLVAEIVDGKLILHNDSYEFTRHMGIYGEICDCADYLESHTTRRHINEFLQQNGFEKMSKSEMVKYYESQ